MVGRELRKFRRISLEKPLQVSLGSIGSDMKYELSTTNISSAGFYFNFEEPHRLPFNTSSIIEVWVKFEDDKSVFFSGKLSRVVYPEDELASIHGAGFGTVGIHSMSARNADTGSELTKWESETSVRCMVGQGALLEACKTPDLSEILNVP